jgi:hypothetical protein
MKYAGLLWAVFVISGCGQGGGGVAVQQDTPFQFVAKSGGPKMKVADTIKVTLHGMDSVMAEWLGRDDAYVRGQVMAMPDTFPGHDAYNASGTLWESMIDHGMAFIMHDNGKRVAIRFYNGRVVAL